MPRNLNDLCTALSPSGLVAGCQVGFRGHLRLQTKFLYPDGSAIDLFVANEEDLLSDHELTLTDFGQTIGWLSNMGIWPKKNKRRAQILSDIMTTYRISNIGAALMCRVRPDDLLGGLIRLGQACVRVADLTYTQRFVARSRFEDQFEEVIAEFDVDYETKVGIVGRFNNIVTVDFLVHGRNIDTAVMTLSSETRLASQAKIRAEHVFATFTDLIDYRGQRLAALDDRAAVYENADINRIQTVASVVAISDLATLQPLLLAA